MPASALLRLLLVAGIACWLAACGTEPAPSAGTAPLQTTPAATTPTAATPTATTPTAAIALLTPEARAALAAAPVPMLMLPDHRARASTFLVGDRWASFHYRDAELTISLHATDLSHPVVADDEIAHLPPPPDTVRGRPARVLLNEQIRSVAWEQGPVSYALDVECARPFDDTRCTEPEFVLELADALIAAPWGAR